MIDMRRLEASVDRVRGEFPQARPACGLILGSGWGDAMQGFRIRQALDYREVPALGPTTVSGHAGRLLWAEACGVETLVFQGRRHWYEGGGWDPVAFPLYLLRRFAASAVVLTNAAGGIRSDLPPGRLMLIQDHINAMGVSPLSGPHHDVWGPRFPDMSTVYDPGLRDLCRQAAASIGEPLPPGVYMAVPGPAFETPAEIRACRALGADAVGMSTVPEATLGHAAGLRVLGLSCISNWAAGIADAPLSHANVAAALSRAMPRLRMLIDELWKRLPGVLSHE